MRIGNNPQRHKKVNLGDYFHQVIIPVYIPHFNNYYKESFDVFKLSIQSLIKTSHLQTYISIISNGSCKEVNDYIISLHNEHKIQDFTITKGIGKVNAILKGLSGINLPLVTITDADVLFLNGWQQATYEVFNQFPKAGVVSPVPNPTLGFYKSSNIFRDNFFSRNINYTKIKNVDAVLRFAQSIDRFELFKKKYSDKYLTICNKNFKAVIGAGHFVATYKAQLFDHKITRYTDFVLGGKSEDILLDKKAIQNGLWRLSTEDNYAYHLGNTLPKWAIETYNSLLEEEQDGTLPNNTQIKPINFFRSKYEQISNRLFDSYKFRAIFLKRFLK